MIKQGRVRILAISAALAAFSTVVQLVHIGYQSPQWGMWIDIVAVSWLIAYFLFGLRPAIIVSILGALMITLFAPDTWLGASMKWMATIPVILSFFAIQKISRIPLEKFNHWSKLFLPVLIGFLIRAVIVIPVNYFYAIPIWTGMSPEKAMAAIPWYIIAAFNLVQTIVDVGLAWVLVYRFKLSRYATWSK